MTDDQLAKKVEWLEAGKREADERITQLNEQIEKLQGTVALNQETIESYQKQLSQAKATADKVKDVKDELSQIERDRKQALEASEKALKQTLDELESSFREGQRKLERDVLSAREELGHITAIQAKLKAQAEQEARFDIRISALDESIKEVVAGEAKREQLAETLEKNSKRDDKRISEAEGTVAAISKQAEQAVEQVSRIEMAQKNLQRSFEALDEREKQREEKQREFIQKVSSEQVDKDRIWGDWEKRFASIEKQAEDIAARLKELEALDLVVKRAQESFDLMIEKINRRVNELTEIQRLGEQRFRKEWSTFQADAQKRWTSQTLDLEEQRREADRQREELSEQLTSLEERFLDIDEKLQSISEQSERLFQSLLESLRDTRNEDERFFDNLS